MDDHTQKIRQLNDDFRQGRNPNLGRIMITSGVNHHIASHGGTLGMLNLMRAVREFDAFDKDNDPWSEHDFGSLSLHGETLFWKMDYYNNAMDAGSEDPADTTKTTRVMTIMLASEY